MNGTIDVPLKRGYSVKVKNKENETDEIDVIGNYSKSDYNGTPIINKNGITPTVRENHGQVTAIVENKNCEQLEYDEMLKDDIEDLENEIAYRNGTKDSNLRIRKLTPKECWRLMGFDDIDFERAAKVNSNTQLYKQAGNSIVVNVLEEILKKLLER